MRSIIWEQQNKIKLQILIFEVHPFLYWFSHFIIDYLMMILASLLVFVVLASLSVQISLSVFFLGFFLSVCLFWIPFILMNYSFSLFIKDAENCLSKMGHGEREKEREKERERKREKERKKETEREIIK